MPFENKPVSIAHSMRDRVVDRETIISYPLPEVTNTYEPIAHKDILDLVEAEIGKNAPEYKLVNEEFVTNKDRQRMFFKLFFKAPNKPNLVWGGRNGYDHKTAYVHGFGSFVSICSNMQLSSEFSKTVQIHRPGCWDIVKAAVQKDAVRVRTAANEMRQDRLRFQFLGCKTRHGFEYLGVMRAAGVLTSKQMTDAMNHWRNPTFEEFEHRTVWSLYNSCTWAFGKGRDPQKILESHIQGHRWFKKEFSL